MGGFAPHMFLVLGLIPSHTLVVSLAQCKAPVMGVDLSCLCLRSCGDSFTCHKYWKSWGMARGTEYDEEKTMGLMGTELAWIRGLHSFLGCIG